MIAQLGDRYDILELLGEGGMGAVYRARDRELDEIVALKLIRADLAADPEIVERFRREVKLARRVTHANVARTFELGFADGHVFCTMELIEGESLTERLAAEKRLKPGEAVAIACAVCDALTAAHAADVIHRDIKPDNILLASDGRVVLADFGVASVHTGARGELSGTPAYMAPEQAAGEPPTPAADIYAVGLVLCEMISGRRAFQGTATQMLDDKLAFERIVPGPNEVEPELADVIGRATARERGQRIGSAAELRRALEPWARRGRVETAPPTESHARDQLATIVVLAPRGGDKLYLADAVYEQLVASLSREPRLRVLSRADAIEPGAVTLRLQSTESSLIARAERDARALVVVEVPLAIDQVEQATDAIHRAVCRLGAPPQRPLDARELEAIDLMLQARHNMRRDIRLAHLAIEQAQRAYELLPGHPRVLATLAIITVRRAFFDIDASDDEMVHAAQYARRAIATAPELVDSHLALGHVEFNAGYPIAAAGHYRKAIARSPHSAEAHEYLGRILLEAGYLDQALARLDEAIAINPSRRGLAWEIARAHALEGRWDEHNRLVREMGEVLINRPFAMARMAVWQRLPNLGEVLDADLLELSRSFAPGFMEHLRDVYMRKPWPESRDKLLAVAHRRWPNKRRRTWVAQIVAEAAGWVGDVEAAADLIAFATADGLFDLHWLEKCPVLDGVRASARYAQLRGPIKRRADAILDAMYGDHDLGTSDTAFATS